MKKNIATAILTAALLAFGLSSDLAKSLAVKIYCSVQPHDCQE